MLRATEVGQSHLVDHERCVAVVGSTESQRVARKQVVIETVEPNARMTVDNSGFERRLCRSLFDPGDGCERRGSYLRAVMAIARGVLPGVGRRVGSFIQVPPGDHTRTDWSAQAGDLREHPTHGLGARRRDDPRRFGRHGMRHEVFRGLG